MEPTCDRGLRWALHVRVVRVIRGIRVIRVIRGIRIIRVIMEDRRGVREGYWDY